MTFWKRTGCLGVGLALVWTYPALGGSMGREMSFGLDVVVASPFGRNPAAVAVAARPALSIAGTLVPEETRRVADSDGFVSEQRSDSATNLGAALIDGSGASGWYGLALQSLNRHAGTDEGRSSEETFRDRSMTFAYALPLAHEFWLGLGITAVNFAGKSLPFSGSVTSDAEGWLFGVGAGLLWGKAPAFSLFFVPPVRGSAHAEGENRIVGYGGQAGVQAGFKTGVGSLIGLELVRHLRDESAELDLADFESPAGTAPGFAATAGYKVQHRGNVFTKYAIARELRDERSGDVDPLATTLRGGVGINSQGGESLIGMGVRLHKDGDAAGWPYEIWSRTWMAQLTLAF